MTEDLLMKEVLNYDIRKDIFLLLRLYSELNVTQISNLLNRSKATVGRHLKVMQEKEILSSREKQSNKTINPLYYSIRPDKILALLRRDELKSKDDYTRSLSILRMIYNLVEHAIGLVNPFIEHLDSKINDGELEGLDKYLGWREHLSVKHIVLSEEDIGEFWNLYQDFYKKLELLSNKRRRKKEQTLLFVDSLLPLKEMLKHSGKNNKSD